MKQSGPDINQIKSNQSTITTTDQNIFYLVSNSSYVLNSLSNNFSLTSSGVTGAASSRLTYNGSVVCPFNISSSVTYLCAGSNNQNIVTKLSQNGVLIPTSKATSALAAANLSQCNNMIAVVNLNPNDYIECQVANLTAILTAHLYHKINKIIKPFFNS